MKSLRGRRREGFQRQYPMWNCLWLPSKWKVISAVDSSIKYKKIGMEEGIMPTKSLQTGWRRETFQAQHPMWNCSWLPWKEIIISAMDTNMKFEKVWMELSVNQKIQWSRSSLPIQVQFYIKIVFDFVGNDQWGHFSRSVSCKYRLMHSSFIFNLKKSGRKKYIT